MRMGQFFIERREKGLFACNLRKEWGVPFLEYFHYKKRIGRFSFIVIGREKEARRGRSAAWRWDNKCRERRDRDWSKESRWGKKT